MEENKKNEIYGEIVKALNEIQERYKQEGVFIDVNQMLVNNSNERVNKTLNVGKNHLVMKMEIKDLSTSISELDKVLSDVGNKNK